jgi:hypothetical protein
MRQPDVRFVSPVPRIFLLPGGEFRRANAIAGEVSRVQTVQLGMRQGDKTRSVRFGDMFGSPCCDRLDHNT